MNKLFYKISIYTIIISILIILVPTEYSIASSVDNSAYVVIEESTNRILYEENSDAKLPMASTTKIITAIVTLEHANLEDEVIIPREAVGIEGSSIYLRAGESYTIRDLLHGLMLRSGNDSAVALALHVGGTIENFAKLMNDKAQSVGAYNTNFTNPHGLHDKNHYTTARDLAILTSYAYKNADFREIVSARKYNLKGEFIYNKNKLLSMYDGADGVKTGYTTKSGRCLVSASKRGDMRVICVVLNCYDMWNKSISLMNKAHSEYSLHEIISPESETKINVIGGIFDTTVAKPTKSILYPLTKSEISKLEYSYEVFDLKAPVYKNEICGSVEVYLDKRLIFKENIYTINNVRKKTLLDWISDLTNHN